MEFRILGPLEVHDRGETLPIRGRRQRALLASLVLGANEVVADERLLEDLWGPEQPASGRAALRVRVSQLRKALEGDVLVTQPPGYVLRVDPDRIDAHRFERLLAAGRAELNEGDAEAAAETLRRALGLWRGPALADFAYEPFAQAEIARLEDLRLAALEERIEADLALGREAEVIGELERLVAQHPLRERLRALLMLALYRAGRQAEALAAYRAARDYLVDALGIEPGRTLQELEQAILRQDASLDPPAPREARPVTAPERKLVTVVVADLSGAPGLAAASDPERRAALLARVVVSLREEIESAGGRVEAVLGDGLTAAFGSPVAQEDHAERALHAALALRARVIDDFGDDFPLRIGVESGDAVVERPEDDGASIAGAVVTHAARIAHAAEPGEILVGSRAATAGERAFELGPARDGAALGSRALVRPLAPAKRGLPLVGRKAEIEALWAPYRRAAEERRPQLVTVVGDAGVGKTRLVEALWERLAADAPESLRRSGRCLAFARGLTYRALADVLRQELALREIDPPELVAERLRGREILGLTLGLDLEQDLHPLDARERLHAAWVDFLDELAASQPVVVLVEDLHWAPGALLDLLERVLDGVRGPLLVVGTARPELLDHRPGWGRRREASTVWLEPLSSAEAARMLAERRPEGLPRPLAKALVERAEGNPFFLEELLASVSGDEAGAGEAVPDSVQAVLAARIDLLPPGEKAALQAASVVGRIFWRGPLAELLDGPVPDLRLLEARDFVRRRSASAIAGEVEYAFKHALTRDVAYGSVPRARRARLHAAFAEWLERVGGGRDEHAAFVAFHFAEAVRPEDTELAWADDPGRREHLRLRAIRWLRRAAELAIARYDLEDGIALLERALELEPSPAAQVELWRAIGHAHALNFAGDTFWEAMQTAAALTSDRAVLAEIYAVLSFETAIRAGMWKVRPDRALVDGWIQRALELAEPGSVARARALIARCSWDPVGAASGRDAVEASAIAERLGDPELRSYAWDARGITAWVAGEQDLGRAFEERRFELVDQLRNPDHVADVYYAPVTGCVWLGYFNEARRLARRHDEITSGLTPHHRVHGVAVLLEVEELAGGWAAIRALEERAERTMEESRDTPCVRNPRSLLLCALARLHAGDATRAAELEELAEAYGIEGYGHVLDTPRIRLALLRGDLARVERLLAEPLPDRGWHRAWILLSTQAARLDALGALGHAREVDEWPTPRRGTYLEPFLLRARGLVHEDEELLAEAAATFERLRLDWHAAETRTLG